jgi:citrate synthase
MAKIYEGYTIQELIRNYKKFQKGAIWFWNGETQKSYRQQTKVWGKYEAFTRNTNKKIWDNEITLVFY